jgi:integrase
VAIQTITGGTKTKEFTATTRDGVLARLQKAKDSGLLRRDRWSDRPLRDYATQWLASLRDSVKPTTMTWYRWDVENRIIPELGAIPLKDISVLVVAHFVEDLLAAGVGRSAVARATRCLSAMLSEAVANEQIEDNPALRLSRKQRPKYRAPDAKTLTLEQLNSLLAQISSRYAAAVVIAAMTGLRQGEILGLKWADVDLENKKLRVERSIVQIGKQIYEMDPKTESSRRTIALPQRVVTSMREHKTRMSREGIDISGSGYLFQTENGKTPARSHLLRKVLRPALKRAGLPAISWRELRHSFASASIELDVPGEALARTLGHKDVGVTHRVYNKAFRARETLVADAWEAVEAVASSDNTVSNKVSDAKPARPKSGRKRRKHSTK